MADFIQNSQVLRWDNTLAGNGIVFTRQSGLGKNVSISINTDIIATVASLDAYQSIDAKDQAGGYAGLDETGKLSTSQINFDTSTFYVDENGILKLKTDRISNPFTASGVDTSGIPTGLMLGTDEATIDEVEINDTIRFTTAISWNETNYEAQTVFMRVASTAGTLADFAVQGAPVTSLDQIEQGVVNKYLTAEQLEKLIRMNFSDIAYTGQLSSTEDDCNLYLTTGVWNVPNASAIANTPQKGQGGILICFQRGTYTSSARIQLYLQAAGTSNPVIPYIRVYNGTAGTWSVWERIIKSTDTATTATSGLLSAADKAKLDGLLTQAQLDDKYIINTAQNSSGKILVTCTPGSVDTNTTVFRFGTNTSYMSVTKYATGADSLVVGNTNGATYINSSSLVNIRSFVGNTASTSGIMIDGATFTFTPPGGTASQIQTEADIAVALRSSIYLATTSENGLLSAADKAKLNGIESGAQVNVLEDIQINGESLQIQGKSVTLPESTALKAGLQSATDKAKLDRMNIFESNFDFALAPTQGRLILVLKNAPATPPWNFHTEIELQQFSGAASDRTEPARYVAEGHYAVGEYDLLVTDFPITAVNGRYQDSGGRVWTHSTLAQYTIQYLSGRWRICDGDTILYSTHSDDGNPYGTIDGADGSWVWCTGDTMSYLTGPKVVADTSVIGSASWRSVNYNASSITNFLEAGKYTSGDTAWPALILTGKFTQGKVIVRHLDYSSASTETALELIASTTEAGTIQTGAAKRYDPVPGNLEWESLTTQLIQSTNRGDGVRRSYCASLVLGAMQYTGSLGWSATGCTIETPTISLDLQNTPTDFAMDIDMEEGASGKEFALSLANGIQGTHCAVSFRNTSSYRIGLTDGNGKTVYLNGGETALARLVSAGSENRFEWISSGTGSSSGGGGGTEYVTFTAEDVDENGNLTIVSAGEPVAICKTDLSNRLDFGITAQESAGAGLLKSTINISGIQLGSGSWYAICK